MAHISFTSPDGTSTTVDAPDGEKVMKVAKQNGILGIVGACGGNLQCATCHVLVDEGHEEKVGRPSPAEDLKLNETAHPRQANSRLSCQILVSDELDGLCLTVAPVQR